MSGKARNHPPVPAIVLLVVLLAVGGWWWWRSGHPAEAASTAVSGQVEARQFQVASAIAGRVATVAVAEGDVVKEGATLVTLDTAALTLQLDQAKHQWPVIIGRIDQQLQHAPGDFLFGEPSIADFALAHPLWFLKGSSVTAPLVDAYPAVAAWLDRVLSFGHGTSTQMSAEQALEISRNATPANLPDEVFDDLNGFTPGQQVTISATDYGTDPVAGELLFAGREELILRRTDERAGTVHVHFPRMGFRIQAQ